VKGVKKQKPAAHFTTGRKADSDRKAGKNRASVGALPVNACSKFSMLAPSRRREAQKIVSLQ
jgi:hypothetical protein